jgi:histidinol-phosphate aminotransferase
MKDFLDALPRHVGVVYDEVYHHFTQSGDYTTAVDWVQQGYPVIAVNSFSKAFGLAGLRVGYAYAAPELAGYLRQLSKPFLISSIGMAGAMAALEDHAHVTRTVQLVHKQKNRLYHIFEELGIVYWSSQGNFVLFQLPLPLDVVEAFMLKEGVMIRPIQRHGDEFLFRVSVGNDWQMQIFESALTSLTSAYQLHSVLKV